MSDDPTFEREKWVIDVDLRKRELELKEREQQNRDAELGLKERDQRTSAWRNPLIVAILAAAAAGAGNALVATVNGRLQRELEDNKRTAEIALERSKAESTRILEMIKTGDPEHAASNLEFLVQSGLISDQQLLSNIQTFLKQRQPGSGPSLPSPSGRVSFEKSDFLTASVEQKLQDTLTRYFGYLDRIGFPKPNGAVTVSIEAMDSPNAYYVDNRIVMDRRMAEDASAGLREYNHHLLIKSKSLLDGKAFRALESGLADYFACSFLNSPNVGEKLGKLFNLKTSYIRTLKNDKTHTDSQTVSEWDEGEAWGGFFWDLRDQLGASDADELIASTWLSFVLPKDESIPSAFIAGLLKAAKAKGPDVLETVRAASASRKFSL